jgi:hypothetical protein
MAINFPSTNLVANVTTYTTGGSTWIWNGVTWNVKPPGSNLDDLADVDVALATDGQVLYYDGNAVTWKATTLSSTFNGGILTGTLNINNSTASTDTTHGALVVAGGVGIGGELHVGNSLTVASGLTVSESGASITGNSSVTGTFYVTSTTSLRTRAELRFNDTDNSNYVGFRAPNNLTVNTTYQLPTADGTSGQVLSTNGSGVLSWVTGGTGGGGGGSANPIGADKSVQYNNNGSFGGQNTFTYDTTSDTVSLSNLTANGTVDGASTATITNFASITFITGATVDTFDSDNTLTGNSDTSVATQAAVKTYVDTGLGLKAPIDGPTFTGTVGGITNSMVGLGNVEDTALSTWAGSSSITTVGTLTNLSVAGNISVPTQPSQTTHAANKRYVDTRAIAMSIALS